MYSGPNILVFFLLAFLESLLISVLIKIWLYLTDVILDGTCSSISSWHMLLKCSHRLLILVLMVLTSIKVFNVSNIYDFKFIISFFFSKDRFYAGYVVGIWHKP